MVTSSAAVLRRPSLSPVPGGKILCQILFRLQFFFNRRAAEKFPQILFQFCGRFFFNDTALTGERRRAAATLCAFSAAVPHIPRHPRPHTHPTSSRGTVARRAIIKVGEMPPMYTAVAGFIAPITLLYTYIIRASCPPVCRRCRRTLRGGWDPAPRGEPLNMTEGSRRPSLPTPAPTRHMGEELTTCAILPYFYVVSSTQYKDTKPAAHSPGSSPRPLLPRVYAGKAKPAVVVDADGVAQIDLDQLRAYVRTRGPLSPPPGAARR